MPQGLHERDGAGRPIVGGRLAEVGKAGIEQRCERGIVENLGRKLARALVLCRKAADGDLQDPQVETRIAQRPRAVGQVGMAGGKGAIGDREIAGAHAAEPTAAAELLVDADAVARRVADVGLAALDRVGRGLQLHKGAIADLAQRELPVKACALFALELRRDPE